MVIPNPFFQKTVSNFNLSLLFGLYDIFNYLIYHSTDYDNQGLAAYKSFEDYQLLICLHSLKSLLFFCLAILNLWLCEV